VIANDAPDIICLGSEEQGAFLTSRTELTLCYKGLTVQSDKYKVNKELRKCVGLRKQVCQTQDSMRLALPKTKNMNKIEALQNSSRKATGKLA